MTLSVDGFLAKIGSMGRFQWVPGLCGGRHVGSRHVSDPDHDVPWFRAPLEVCP